jgi:hypothetical protein
VGAGAVRLSRAAVRFSRARASGGGRQQRGRQGRHS